MRRVLVTLGDVTVVAPESCQSATGHAITVGDAVIADHVDVDGEFSGHSVVGRPVDCVKLAVHELLDEPPDLVVSGINAGANIGVNVLYSGTVAAALEATYYRLPAVAVSFDCKAQPDYDRAAAAARQVIRGVIEAGLTPGWLMNVNIPDLGDLPPRGIKVVRQSTQVMYERFVKADDPRGRRYFWLTGGFDGDGEPDTDLRALNDGFVAVTPLRFDLTCHDELDAMKQWQWPAIDGLDADS